MPVSTRRRYTDAFKAEAVRLVSESGRPVAQRAVNWASLTMCYTAGSVDRDRPTHRGQLPRLCARNVRSWRHSRARICGYARSGIF